MDPTEVVRSLYTALDARNGEAMASWYAPDAQFSDPVFPELVGEDVGDMWRMLTRRATDLKAEVADIRIEGDVVRATWQAWYTFSASGRKVHNVGQAAFRIRDGRIVDHTDTFDFPRWAAQALGWKGRMFGHTRFLRRSVQRGARAGLRKFQGS